MLGAVDLHGRNWKMIVDTYFKNRAPLALKNRYSLLLRRESHNSLAKDWEPASSAASSGFATPKKVAVDSKIEGSMEVLHDHSTTAQERCYDSFLEKALLDAFHTRPRKRHQPSSSPPSTSDPQSELAQAPDYGDFGFGSEIFSDLARGLELDADVEPIPESANKPEDGFVKLDMEQICAENKIDIDESIASFQLQPTSLPPPLGHPAPCRTTIDSSIEAQACNINSPWAQTSIPAPTIHPASSSSSDVAFSWPTTPTSNAWESGPNTPRLTILPSFTQEVAAERPRKRITLTAHCPEAELGAFLQSIMAVVNSMAGDDRHAVAKGITLNIE